MARRFPMKISKKAEYALRAVAAMGRSPVGTTFSIQEIASSERIPLKFLEQILLILKNGGLLRSKRGVGGGYQLTIPPAKISLREVIELVDGPFEPIPCVKSETRPTSVCECGISGGCGLGRTLAGLRDVVHDWLSSTSVADVIERDASRDTVSFDI